MSSSLANFFCYVDVRSVSGNEIFDRLQCKSWEKGVHHSPQFRQFRETLLLRGNCVIVLIHVHVLLLISYHMPAMAYTTLTCFDFDLSQI